MSDLNVALTLSLINKLSGPAGQGLKSLAQLREEARRLNGTKAGGDLKKNLEGTAKAAVTTTARFGDLRAAAVRLGSARGPQALTRDLERASAAASTLERRLDATRRKVRGIGGSGGGRNSSGSFGAGAAEATRDALYNVPGLSGAIVGAASAAGATGAATVAGIAGAGVALGVSAREASRFESAMAEIRKAVDGLDDSQLKAMEQDILAITRATPLARDEVAKLIAQAGFAGRPVQDLQRFATFAAKAATAFGMGGEESGDKLAKLGNVFKLNQEGIEDTANAVNLLGDSTAAKERDIIEFLTRTGAGAQLLKMTANETAALGAAMLELGTAPEVAATGANALMTKLATAGKQGKDFQEALQGIGLDAKKVAELLRKGPADALLEIGKRINALKDEKKIDVLEGLGGGEYVDDFARLFGNLKGLSRAFDMVRDAQKRAGSVERTFKIFDETTEAKVTKLGNAFRALGTNIGQGLTGPLGAAADKITELLNKLNVAYQAAGAREQAIQHLAEGKDPEAMGPAQKWAYAADPDGVNKAKDRLRDDMARERAQREKDRSDARATLASGSLDERLRGARARVEAAQRSGGRDLIDARQRLRDVEEEYARTAERAAPSRGDRTNSELPGQRPDAGREEEGPPIPKGLRPAIRPAAPAEPPSVPSEVQAEREKAAAATRAKEAAEASERDMRERVARERHRLDGTVPTPSASELGRAEGAGVEAMRQKLSEARQEAEGLRSQLQQLTTSTGDAAPMVAVELQRQLEAAEAKVREAEAALQRLGQVSVTPTVSTASIDAASARVEQLRAQIASLGSASAPQGVTQAAATLPSRFTSSSPTGARSSPARSRPSSPAGMNIAAVHLHGVQNVAGFQREMQREADRGARRQRFDALHDTGSDFA